LADDTQAARSGGKNGEIVQWKMVAVRAAALLWLCRDPTRQPGCRLRSDASGSTEGCHFNRYALRFDPHPAD
jgi:hypothetical protein